MAVTFDKFGEQARSMIHFVGPTHERIAELDAVTEWQQIYFCFCVFYDGCKKLTIGWPDKVIGQVSSLAYDVVSSTDVNDLNITTVRDSYFWSIQWDSIPMIPQYFQPVHKCVSCDIPNDIFVGPCIGSADEQDFFPLAQTF